MQKFIEALHLVTFCSLFIASGSQIISVFSLDFCSNSGQVLHSWSPKSGVGPPDFRPTRVTRLRRGFLGNSPGRDLPKSWARFMISEEIPYFWWKNSANHEACGSYGYQHYTSIVMCLLRRKRNTAFSRLLQWSFIYCNTYTCDMVHTALLLEIKSGRTVTEHQEFCTDYSVQYPMYYPCRCIRHGIQWRGARRPLMEWNQLRRHQRLLRIHSRINHFSVFYNPDEDTYIILAHKGGG